MATPAESGSERVKAEARRLGFQTAGVARAEQLTEEGARLDAWLSRGFHATMDWMLRGREKRVDPERVLPGVRSVVSVAMNYYWPGEHSSDPGTGKISRYAWGTDYHEVVGDRLEVLEAFLAREFPGSRSRRYVDTGPVMDKAWAARAGVGWLGKHTNIITRETGSWVFLGTLLTTAELEPDRPETDMCGSCTACIEACPTGAIVDAYVLDASRCISYLTIEHRGDLPEEMAGELDRWVFGCDVCQDVCPWNRFQRPTAEAAFAPGEGVLAPDLRELASVSQEEFSRRFRGTAVKRAKAEGIRRNAAAGLEPFSA